MYPKTSTEQATPPPRLGGRRGRRIQMRRSGVHGKGVFALQALEPGDRVIEYTGELISWTEALQRHPHDPADPDHTFFFHIDDKRVIDGGAGGGIARWINHGCDPNCDSEVVGDKVYIRTLRPVEPGEELVYDYRLVIDERHTPALKKQFECRCGAANCRGTMLAPKRRAARAGG